MIVALLNQHGGVGRTRLALPFAGEWASRNQPVVFIGADPQAHLFDWTEARAREEGPPRGFVFVGPAPDKPNRKAPGLARGAERFMIDGPPRVAELTRSGLLAADLDLIPVRPLPFDGSASAEMLALLRGSRLFRPSVVDRADAIADTMPPTTDVTPDLRGRIKVTAFQRGETVADMLREFLAGALSAEGDAP